MKPSGPRPTVRRRGFTLLEMTVILLLSGVTLGYAAVTFSDYARRASAQRAAQIFARDLVLARSSALRARAPVVVRFYESSRWYAVVMQQSGAEVVRRRFGTNGDIDLSSIDLYMGGDTVLFNRRGVASLSNAFGSLGEARFTAGTVRFDVTFNAMGASKVEEK